MAILRRESAWTCPGDSLSDRRSCPCVPQDCRGRQARSDHISRIDDGLRVAFERETELLLDSVLLGDRSVLELLNANYTFVNERLARHYGIPDVYGDQFRRVTVNDGIRGGLLGQGSILTATSYPNRTSPVVRGKWILETLLGSPPPLPPPDVPALREAASTGKVLSMRERLSEHRKNRACAGCHARVDPLGFRAARRSISPACCGRPPVNGLRENRLNFIDRNRIRRLI